MFSIWLYISFWISSRRCIFFFWRRHVLHERIEVRWPNPLWGGSISVFLLGGIIFPVVDATIGGNKFALQAVLMMANSTPNLIFSSTFRRYYLCDFNLLLAINGWAYIASFATFHVGVVFCSWGLYMVLEFRFGDASWWWRSFTNWSSGWCRLHVTWMVET
jgi:hypothetical protein